MAGNPKHIDTSDFGEDGLFELEKAPPIKLADRFLVPPFSTLDRRGGTWQERKRLWMSMGIESEVGRDAELTFSNNLMSEAYGGKNIATTSIFDPVLCELVYRWYTQPGARVLDPFCGGSVRGVVASTLARHYLGVDIREEQVEANRAQLHLCSDIHPQWVVGDATRLGDTLGPADEFDLVFSCPPYADLEVYSDDPADISTWTYDEFLDGHAKAIRDACAVLRPDRFAAWVIGDVRDKKTGALRGLHHATAQAFRDAGLQAVNEFVLIDPIGTAAVRSAIPFTKNRKATNLHQHLLVFVKGDLKSAAAWAAANNTTDSEGNAA